MMKDNTFTVLVNFAKEGRHLAYFLFLLTLSSEVLFTSICLPHSCSSESTAVFRVKLYSKVFFVT